MRPYPKELRVRVVAAIEQGEFTRAEIASLCGVGVTFIKRMLGLQRAGQDLAPRQGGGPVARLQAPQWAWLPTLWRALPQLALPRKKSLKYPQRDEPQR